MVLLRNPSIMCHSCTKLALYENMISMYEASSISYMKCETGGYAQFAEIV